MNQGQLAEEIRRILTDSGWRTFSVHAWDLHEDLREGSARVSCFLEIRSLGSEETVRIANAAGTGPVDALFQGMVTELRSRFLSLGSLEFVNVRGEASFDRTRRPSKSDGVMTMTISVQNGHGKIFEFLSSSQSITGSAIAALLEGVEFFVNAELAVLKVRSWIEDANKRGRPEIAEDHTRLLATLMAVTDYTEAIRLESSRMVRFDEHGSLVPPKD